MSAPIRRLRQGGRIDRQQAARASRSTAGALAGFAGDTLASALLANGVTLVGRSFKYHRPRGILSAGVEEPNGCSRWARATGASPTFPATTTELVDGLVARDARTAGRRSTST